MKTTNILRIIEACDTVEYEYSFKYKEAALRELDQLRTELKQWKEKERTASRAFADEHDKVERLRKKIKEEILNSKGRE